MFFVLPDNTVKYEQFWLRQNKAPIAWVALLFAILRITMLDYRRENDEPLEYQGKCATFANTFLNCFMDCLTLADYTKPQEFLIEALCFHLYAEYVSSRDANSSVWVLLGTIQRLAMRMGYHQPSQSAFASTPFQVRVPWLDVLYL